MTETAFSASGRFFRGNLHGHSTVSDGNRPVEEVCAHYRDAGYDFIALTDHFVELYGYPITCGKAHSTPDFCMLPGAELHSGAMDNGDIWHILAVGLPLDFTPPKAPHFRPVTGQESGADLAARAREAGAFVAVAHPEWSGMGLSDALSIEAAHSVEIYNHSCRIDADRGEGAYMIDRMLSAGRPISICATDDSHFRNGDTQGGWVMVKAKENTQQALVEALKAGHFYSSTGPEFLDVVWEDRWLVVRSSPVESVVVQGHGSAATVKYQDGMTEARIRLDRFDASPWMRVTLRDGKGGRAWSQPHFRPAPALR